MMRYNSYKSLILFIDCTYLGDLQSLWYEVFVEPNGLPDPQLKLNKLWLQNVTQTSYHIVYNTINIDLSFKM